MKKHLLNHLIARCNILLCLLLAGSVLQPLAAQTYTFTTCGATGQNGPTQFQVNATYIGANSLNGLVTVSGSGIQQWTAPGAGAYYIKAVGASGGPAASYPGIWGKGASMEGVFTLTNGQVLKIIVGQQGQGSSAGGSGGGGSFVADILNTPLIVAGGGSGGGNYANAVAAVMDGRVTNYGANYQSTGRATAGGGGGSFAVSGLNANGGTSFIGGGVGGALGGANGGLGGFGGGAGSSGSNALAAGGGGYSGGDEMYGYQFYQGQEGGGGSYNAGTSQVNAGGVNTGDGIVIITRLCNISLVPTQNPICIGASITLSTNAVSGITWGGSGSTGNSISVNPLVTTSYSVTGTSTANCQTTNVITVTVHPLPVISAVVSPTTLCVGSTATITANGADTYTWSTGPSGVTTTVIPGITTTYSVGATSIYGCFNTNTVAVIVNSNSLTVTSNTTICEGNQVNLSALGAITYTWSNGSMFQTVPVSPTVNTTYNVSATDIFGCVLSNMVTVTTVSPPAITISANKTLVCRGDFVTLTAGGTAVTYTWSSGDVGATATYTLPVDVTYYYSVTGADASGCTSMANIAVTANKCLAITEVNSAEFDMTLIPNPGTGLFNLQVNTVKDNLHMSIYNTLGMLIKSEPVVTGNNQLDIRNEKAGIYFIYVNDKNDNTTQVIKLIKE